MNFEVCQNLKSFLTHLNAIICRWDIKQINRIYEQVNHDIV